MEQDLQQRVALFVRNRDAVRSLFRFQSAYIYPLCAMLYTSRGLPVDAEALTGAIAVLKANVGCFSNFRSLARYPVATQLALDGDPQTRMDRSLIVFDSLKEDFMSSAYLPVAAVTISGAADPAAYAAIAARTRLLYLGMRKNHPLLTSSEDAVYAALLAMSPREDDALLSTMEQCYRILKPVFLPGNPLQALCAVLALADLSPADACARTLSLYHALAAAGLRYGRGYELPTLGALALSGIDEATLVRDMQTVNAYLSHQRGFGAMGIGRRQRLMYAGLLLLSKADERLSADTAAITSALALIIAQQAAVCAAVAATAASSASS